LIDFISAFLGDPLELRGDDDCTYHLLSVKTYGINDDVVAKEICLANHSYQVGPATKPCRILRNKYEDFILSLDSVHVGTHYAH